MKRLYALDMGSLAGWLYFARENEEDGLLLGLRAWIASFTHELKPDHVIACLDAGYARRSAIDPEYKLARKTKPKPEAFIEQLRKMPALLDELGLPAMRCDGEEADDCVASVVAKFAGADLETIVVSSDKDLGALVSDRCKQYDPRPDKDGNCRFWDVAGVTARLGVPPWRVSDLLAIAGDSADSIKGIKGIGVERAKCAIQQTKSAAEIFRKAAKGELRDLGAKTQATIAAGRAEYEHALKLVELRVDIPAPELEALVLGRRAA